jgi:alpha-L-fucosidase
MQRRDFIIASLSALTAARSGGAPPLRVNGARRPRPTDAQLRWQRDELALFLHFGVNTFMDREWGDGREDPRVFAPTSLDARQWARVARDAGFRAMILTAKHHDGFCLWPTSTTQHSVASSPFRGGNGDVVREFVDACRAFHLRPGLYLSPWDRNHPTYGDSARYNDVYATQLTELLTRYGPIAEVWFDGANGEGPNGKRQVCDWPRTFALVRRLQPDAVMFSDAGPDIRWCGNERGEAGDPNWSTVDPSVVPYPGANGPGITEALQHGDPKGMVWRPAEVDVSIRPGWFYHRGDDEKVRTGANLLQLYSQSVGRNAKLLLNVPPSPAGLLADRDIAALTEFLRLRDAEVRRTVRAPLLVRLRPSTTGMNVELGQRTPIDAVRLGEDIERGQRVARYSVSGLTAGGWKLLSRGSTIGYAKIDRFARTPVTRVRLEIEDALDPPRGLAIAVFAAPESAPPVTRR